VGENEDMSTEKARERTFPDEWLRRDPMAASSSSMKSAGFLDLKNERNVPDFEISI
jgi:hypothetical protein